MAQWVPPPLPAEFLVRRRGPFVGRAAELAVFEQVWQRVEEGGRQVVFIGGEPGAGKSRLAAEIAGTLAQHDVAVLVGSSTADAGVPYEPFAEAIDRLLDADPDGYFSEPLADSGPQLRLLSTRLDRHMPEDGAPDKSGSGRRPLFNALTSFLRRLADDRPIALILEDLHWAQLPTLAMLEHVVAGCADIPLLVVATFRTTPPDRSDQLVSRLAEMHRFDGVRRLDLAGLDTDAIVEFVHRTGEVNPPAATRSSSPNCSTTWRAVADWPR